MGSNKKSTSAMPSDDRRGAPDGVNSQVEDEATGGSDAGAPYPEPHKDKEDKDSDMNGPDAHGGQSKIGYHGSGQLGEREVEPGGNPNAGAKDG